MSIYQGWERVVILTGINGYSSVLDNIQKIIDEEIGSDEFAIFGYSFGGMLARALTYMKFRKKFLVLGNALP